MLPLQGHRVGPTARLPYRSHAPPQLPSRTGGWLLPKSPHLLPSCSLLLASLTWVRSLDVRGSPGKALAPLTEDRVSGQAQRPCWGLTWSLFDAHRVLSPWRTGDRRGLQRPPLRAGGPSRWRGGRQLCAGARSLGGGRAWSGGLSRHL